MEVKQTKKILIIANGEDPGEDLINSFRNSCDVVIAADGGALTCIKYGLSPDFIVGDMDSFSDYGTFSDRVIMDSDQETNDLEKALNLARNKDASHVVVLGATGERLDQTLKNISVMAGYQPHFDDLIFMDRMGWMKILPKHYSFVTRPGTIVSLFPISGTVSGITTVGLEFPLKSESLQNGVRDGSSNRATGNQVSLAHEEGILLLMVFDRLSS